MSALSVHDVSAALRAPDVSHIDVGRAQLAHFRFGAGPSLVFVHGWPLHSATYRAVVPALAERFTCHLIDLPSAGRSTVAAGAPLTLHDYAESLRRAIDALGLDRYVLVAHDSGAGIARFLAAHDSRAVGLVLGDTEIPGFTPAIIRLYQATLRVPGGTAIVRRLLSVAAVRRSPIGFGGCFTDPRFVDGEFGDWFVRPLLEDDRYFEAQLGLLRALRQSEVNQLADAHRAIRVPVRFVWGTDDPIFPIARARPMKDQLAGPVEWFELAGARAFHHEDRPAEFARHVAEHAERCFG